MTSTIHKQGVGFFLHSLDQTVQELSGKIVVKRRDNESARQVQLDAIEKNEGFLKIKLIKTKMILKKSSPVYANGSS